jgi:FlaA1/EpsC-like NDP-sugar epimerase
MKNVLTNKTILLTGGTGSFGYAFTKIAFKYNPKKIIIFSRDEYKQYEMSKEFPKDKYPIRFFLGDMRDEPRLCRALEGVDYVIHAAALKQIVALEYNPLEAVKTNITGAENLISASLKSNVQKVIALSTDKAVNPINLYGATKLVAEKLFLAANAYGGRKVKFSIVRYGNVVNSRGSVIQTFLELKKQKEKYFPITDPRMTRFWISLSQAVGLVFHALTDTEGGDIYIPKLPSMRIVDVARAIEPNCLFYEIGKCKGEKIHESLDENYRSDNNDKWLTKKELWRLINDNCDSPSPIDKYKISS